MTRKKASILTYNTKREEFESMYERNQFYRGLFGYKQKVKRNGKTYKYEKTGLMDEIPTVRIDDSVFIIKQEHEPKIKEYFNSWKPKVSHHIFTVILEQEEILQELQKSQNNQKEGEDQDEQKRQRKR